LNSFILRIFYDYELKDRCRDGSVYDGGADFSTFAFKMREFHVSERSLGLQLVFEQAK
jgi:hypothetical protein